MAFSLNRTSGGYGLSSEINITPLIDVLLVILIIFMVIVPVMPRGLNAALPSAATADAANAATDLPILVQVEQGQTTVRYLIDGVDFQRAEVAPRLSELLSRRSVRQMLVKGDAKVDFGAIAVVIDAGYAAGAESVGLLTPEVDLPSK